MSYNNEFLSLTEAAARAGLCGRQFARRLARGDGPDSVRVGRCRIVPLTSFNAWLAAQPSR